MPYGTPAQKLDKQSKECLFSKLCEKCLHFISANTDRKPKSEPTKSQKNTANLNVCQLRCVYITGINKDTMGQYTGLYYSNHK
jgi:hypothetical protein